MTNILIVLYNTLLVQYPRFHHSKGLAGGYERSLHDVRHFKNVQKINRTICNYHTKCTLNTHERKEAKSAKLHEGIVIVDPHFLNSGARRSIECIRYIQEYSGT